MNNKHRTTNTGRGYYKAATIGRAGRHPKPVRPVIRRDQRSRLYGIGLLLVAILASMMLPGPLCAQEAAEGTVLPASADAAYAKGDVARGNKILNDLIAGNPGNIDLAVEALHRICLEEFLELLDTDWLGMQMRERIMRNNRGDRKKIRQMLSEHVHGSLLRPFRYLDEDDREPAINHLRRMTAESPIDGGREYYIHLIRESLVRRKTYPELTPRDRWPDEAPRRLLALRRAGFVGPDHPAVVDAFVLLIQMRRQQRRYLEAVRLMDELAAGCGNDLPWLLARAKLYHRVGSPRAGELFRQLFQRIGESHVDERVKDVWERAQPYAHYADRRHGGRSGEPKGWLAQMEPDDEHGDWAMVLRGDLGRREERVDRLIQRTLGSNINVAYMLGKDDTRVAMSSCVLDAHLKSLGNAELAALRKLQEAKCRVSRRAANLNARSQTELLALFRRYPWAATAQRALQIYAERELEAGHGQAARRALQDLCDHTTDPKIRLKAQVGFWMVAALSGDPNELAGAFEGTADDEKFPWMGAEATAKSIRQKLLLGMPESEPDHADAPALDALKPQLLKIPAVKPWPDMSDRTTTGLEMMALQPSGSNLLVSSRNILAWYDVHNTSHPVWTQLRRIWDYDRSNGALGLFRPAIHGKTIYTRWGYRAHTSHLAALDATAGRVLWGTAVPGPPESERSVPFGNPAFSGGQLYAAAGWTGKGPQSTHWGLTCVDADSGTLVWNSEFTVDSGALHHGWYQGIYGDAVTVCDGAVYCSPSAGIIIRCDARDGRMEWIQRYESKHSKRQQAVSLGSAPIIAGDVVLCLPRDADDVMGLDRRTGRILWKNPLVLPVESLGVFNDTLIVRGRSILAAFDVQTGRVRWFTTLTEPNIGRAVRLGSSVYVRTQTQLHRFDAGTGIELETRPWPKTDNPVSNFAISGDRLYLLTNEPCSADSYRLGQPLNPEAAGTAGPLRFPIQPCWTLRGCEPKLFLPPEGTSPENRALLHSSEIVQCVETTPRGGIVWRRFVGPKLKDVFFLDGNAILLFMEGGLRRVVALDMKTGNSVWRTELPVTTHRYARSGPLLFVRSNERLATVDLTSGKLLAPCKTPLLFSGTRAGFGGGKIQMISSARYKNDQSMIYWGTYDPLTGQTVGAGEELRGMGGDKNAMFLNAQLRNVAFGSHAAYFTAHIRVDKKHRPETFRCDYKDRSVRLIQAQMSICEFKAPYLLTSIEPDKSKPDNERVYTWIVLRDDDPSYKYVVQADKDENGKMTLQNGLLLQTFRDRRTLRAHDLRLRKELLAHKAEGAEYLGAVQDSPETLLVYSYQRHRKFLLTPYDLRSGRQGPATEIPFPRGRALGTSDLQVSRNMLFITDGESLRACMTANGKQ